MNYFSSKFQALNDLINIQKNVFKTLNDKTKQQIVGTYSLVTIARGFFSDFPSLMISKVVIKYSDY